VAQAKDRTHRRLLFALCRSNLPEAYICAGLQVMLELHSSKGQLMAEIELPILDQPKFAGKPRLP
jgi:hypothetical protein